MSSQTILGAIKKARKRTKHVRAAVLAETNTNKLLAAVRAAVQAKEEDLSPEGLALRQADNPISKYLTVKSTERAGSAAKANNFFRQIQRSKKRVHISEGRQQALLTATKEANTQLNILLDQMYNFEHELSNQQRAKFRELISRLRPTIQVLYKAYRVQ